MAEELSSTDYTVLWVSFACMFFSFVVFYITLKMQPVGKRLFHAYTCGIVGFASTAYLFMALGKIEHRKKVYTAKRTIS